MWVGWQETFQSPREFYSLDFQVLHNLTYSAIGSNHQSTEELHYSQNYSYHQALFVMKVELRLMFELLYQSLKNISVYFTLTVVIVLEHIYAKGVLYV